MIRPQGFKRKKSIQNEKQAWAIVTQWYRWIVKYTAIHYRRCVSLYSRTVFSQEWEDCLQVALLASFRAAELFDEGRRLAFPTYARDWIDRLAFKNFLSKRFHKGKLIYFNEELEDEDDNGDIEYAIVDSVNRDNISMSLKSSITKSKLLTSLFVDDMNYVQIGRSINRSKEAVRLRRNTELKRVNVSREKYVL